MKTNHQLGLIALIKRSRPINLITGPIIYSMVFPIMMLDLFVSFYQWTCFPVYGIPKFARKDFIIFDRQELKYLDWVSKSHCTYCAYGVGVLGFVSAVIDATEAYFFPIQHAAKKIIKPLVVWPRIPYKQAANFDFSTHLEKLRTDMEKSQNK